MTQCSRCNKIMEDSEWQVHECENMRNLDDMDFDILTKLATGKITEAEAWILQDKKDKQC